MKRTEQLVRYVAQGCRPGLQSELRHWLDNSPRFAALITSNQDKVRKKLSTSDEESRLDVRSELVVAYLILADRRFELTLEAYGSSRLGPDLTGTYRANERFNLEVTRLRAVATDDPAPSVARVANVITGKLRQLPAAVPNALVITIRGLGLTEETLSAATRLLKTHSDTKDDAFFERRGLRTARDFHAQYLHLSGIFVLDEGTTPQAIFFANREARHPLSKEAMAALIACLNPLATAANELGNVRE